MIDALTLAQRKIIDLKIPLRCIAEISGISHTDLSGILTGQRPALNDKVLRIVDAVRALENLAEIAAPLPLDYRQPDKLKRAIQQIESGDMRVLVMGDLIET